MKMRRTVAGIPLSAAKMMMTRCSWAARVLFLNPIKPFRCAPRSRTSDSTSSRCNRRAAASHLALTMGSPSLALRLTNSCSECWSDFKSKWWLFLKVVPECALSASLQRARCICARKMLDLLRIVTRLEGRKLASCQGSARDACRA